MKQLSSSTTNEGNRNCWKNARERNRIKARNSIRNRVLLVDNNIIIVNNNNNNDNDNNNNIFEEKDRLNNNQINESNKKYNIEAIELSSLSLEENKDNGSNNNDNNNNNNNEFKSTIKTINSAATKATSHVKIEIELDIEDSSKYIELIQIILQRRVDGNRSYFSLQFMECNYNILTKLILTKYLWKNYQKFNEIQYNYLNNNTKDNNDYKNELLSLELIGESKILSWFLENKLYQFKLFLCQLKTFTIYEYMIWLNRYYICGSFILGGINPCIRGTIYNNVYKNTNDNIIDNNDTNIELESSTLNKIILKRFYSGVPIKLSSYIIKRIVEMRIAIVLKYLNDNNFIHVSTLINLQNQEQPLSSIKPSQSQSSSCTLLTCSMCHEQKNINNMLCYVNTSENTSFSLHSNDNDHDDYDDQYKQNIDCQHQFCEICYWNYILQQLNERYEDDVIVCPICTTPTATPTDDNNNDYDENYFNDNYYMNCQQCYNESLNKYYLLPCNSNELKKSKLKPKKIKIYDHNFLCSTWSQSIKLLIGSTQVIRNDKFFSFIENNYINTIIQNNNNDMNDNSKDNSNNSDILKSNKLYHYIKSCLDNGINIQKQNEYGQTALFISSWYGYINIIKLLLDYGANPYIYSNGGLTCIDAAQANNHHHIVKILSNYQLYNIIKHDAINDDIFTENMILEFRNVLMNVQRNQNIQFEEVIDRNLNHPGAGSFIIDNVFTFEINNKLIQLWNSIPEASDDIVKKKNIPCSIRSYFCDVDAWITNHIYEAIKKLMQVTVADNTNSNIYTTKVIEQMNQDLIIFPHVRFLCYKESGTILAPHVDICKAHPFTGIRSTHSFLLYLSDCMNGGETILLEGLSGEARHVSLSTIQPKWGRLLIFPHNCPHEGSRVEDVPKLLIRGEVRIPQEFLHPPRR